MNSPSLPPLDRRTFLATTSTAVGGLLAGTLPALADFASIATGTVKQFKPAATVEHQSSTYPLGWSNGVSHPLVPQNDFLQGDFYGDALQGSFVRKLLSELTPNRPLGYETSFSTELRDHTGKKSEAMLEAKASAAIADHGAFIFIDGIGVRLRLPGRVRSISQLPGGKVIRHRDRNGLVTFTAPRLQTLAMFAVNHA
jgi:hypothetical protein